MFAHLCLRTSASELSACRQSLAINTNEIALAVTFRSSFITSFPTLPRDDPGDTAVSNLHCSTLHIPVWASGSLNPLFSQALPPASRGTSLAPLNPVSSLETSTSKHTYHIPALKFSYSTYFSSTSSKRHSYCYKYSMFTGSLLGKMSGSFVMS